MPDHVVMAYEYTVGRLRPHRRAWVGTICAFGGCVARHLLHLLAHLLTFPRMAERTAKQGVVCQQTRAWCTSMQTI